MNIGQVGFELNKELSYSPEICSSENNSSQYLRKIIHSESISTDVMSLDFSLEKSIQVKTMIYFSILEIFHLFQIYRYYVYTCILNTVQFREHIQRI